MVELRSDKNGIVWEVRFMEKDGVEVAVATNSEKGEKTLKATSVRKTWKRVLKSEAPKVEEAKEEEVKIENPKEEEEMANHNIVEGMFVEYKGEAYKVTSVMGNLLTLVDVKGILEDAIPAKADAVTVLDKAPEVVEEVKAPVEEVKEAPKKEKKEKAPKVPKAMSGEFELERKVFLEGVLNKVKEIMPGFTRVNFSTFEDRNYLKFGAGLSGLAIFVSVTKKELSVELRGKTKEAKEVVNTIGYDGLMGMHNITIVKELSGGKSTTVMTPFLLEEVIAAGKGERLASQSVIDYIANLVQEYKVVSEMVIKGEHILDEEESAE